MSFPPESVSASSRHRPQWLVAFAFAMTVFGYQVAAPFIQLVAPQGSVPAMVVRAFVLLICALAFMKLFKGNHARLGYLVPLYLFIFAYSLRLYDNFFIRELEWQANPLTAFGTLLGGSVLPALLLTPVIQKLSSDALRVIVWLVAVTFLVGLALNWQALVSAASVAQASLDKLSPIELGGAATAMALALLLLPPSAPLMSAARYALVLALFAVAAFAQARGPIVATAIALLVFALASRGPHRALLFRATLFTVIGVIILEMLTSIDLVQIALSRFLRDPTTFVTPDHNSAWLRLRSWEAAWNQFLEAPAFGDRVFEPTLLHYPHNLFLESLIAVGAYGTCILLIHVSLSFYFCWKVISSPLASYAERLVATMFVSEFIASQFSFAIWSNPSLWFLSACLVTIGANHARLRRAPPGSHSRSINVRAASSAP